MSRRAALSDAAVTHLERLRRGRSRAASRPKLAQREIDRLAALAKALGVEIAALEARPGRMRIITPAGVGLTLDDDEDQLDAEIRALIDDGQD